MKIFYLLLNLTISMLTMLIFSMSSMASDLDQSATSKLSLSPTSHDKSVRIYGILFGHLLRRVTSSLGQSYWGICMLML